MHDHLLSPRLAFKSTKKLKTIFLSTDIEVISINVNIT